jgi:hyperosmotically inducible protein
LLESNPSVRPSGLTGSHAAALSLQPALGWCNLANADLLPVEANMKSNAIRALLLTAYMGVALSSYAQSSDVAPDAGTSSQANSATTTATSDRALAKAVRRALGKAQGVDVSNVFVRARSGAVTLSGSVRDSGQIHQAERVARTVPGVSSVSNKLTLFHGGNG